VLDRIVHRLPAHSALMVVADHDQLNIPAGHRYDLAADARLRAGVTGVAGEPRVRYLYAAEGARDDVVASWREVLGGDAWVVTRDQAVADGWYGPVPPGHLDRIGEVVVICRGRTVALATGWEPPTVGRLVGYHGSVTAAELTVPLLITAA